VLGIGGGTLYLSGFWTLGDNPSEFVGDVQGVDNIAAPSTVKIFNAQYRQRLPGRRLELMFGLYDVNSEFDVSKRGNLFFNASFGIGPSFSGSGVNGPSIYPTTAPAIRLESDWSRTLTVRTAVVNGIAGDPEDPYGTRVEFGGGALLVAEVDHHAQESDDRKLAFGAWTYTALMRSVEERLVGRSASRTKRSYGFYAIADYPVWRGAGGTPEIGVFCRAGHACPEANRILWFVGGGFTFRGTVLFRETDRLGVGFVTAFNGGDYKNAIERLGRPVENAETTIETTGLFGICSGVSIQPDIQYVINPNTDPAIRNAVAVFLRLNAEL
jgi:porin